MRKKNRNNGSINTVIYRKCRYIDNFITKVDSMTSLQLNSCGWQIRDEEDRNYILYKANQDCNYIRHRLSWIMSRTNIVNANSVAYSVLKTGSDMHKQLLRLFLDVEKLIETRKYNTNLSNSIYTVHTEFNIISEGEWLMFKSWLYKNIIAFKYNYIVNKSKIYWEKNIVFENKVRVYTKMIEWSIKSCPKEFGREFAINNFFSYRYVNRPDKDEMMKILSKNINKKTEDIARVMLQNER